MQIVPNSPAGEMARQNPVFLGAKLKECWAAGDGTTVRDMLTPVEPMQQEASCSSEPTPSRSVSHSAKPTASLFADVVLPSGSVAEVSSNEEALGAEDMGFDLF